MSPAKGRRAATASVQSDQNPADRPRWSVTAVLALVVLLGAFTLAELNSYSTRSATWDEPMHLTAGYAALSSGDYRLDPSHPPLLRMWAALPLLFTPGPKVDTAAIDATPAAQWLNSSKPAEVSRALLFGGRSGADRRLNLARLMIVLLGVVTGAVVFVWAFQWLGLRAAVAALWCYALSPNITAHAALVTTDFGATATFFVSVYFLWRVSRAPGIGNAIALSLAVAAAIVTKFSGVLLLPVVALLLPLMVRRGRLSAQAAVGVAGLIVVTTIAVIWTVYGFRYAPGPSPDWLFALHREPSGSPLLSALVAGIDTWHLLPNAFSEGLLFAATSSAQPAYLLGQYSTTGWWYYFPVALLVKTPEPLLLLVCGGLGWWLFDRTRATRLDRSFVVVPAAVYGAFAMTSGINIGLRHVLPLYPFFFLIAGAAVNRLMAVPRWWVRPALAAMVLVWIAGRASTYPSSLTYFNLASGGPTKGLAYLADSNLDWGQHLKLLKSWMAERQVSHINLAYFGQADPEYYGIHCTYLPSVAALASRVERPQLPGYVAISATILSGVYLQPSWRVFYGGFKERVPDATIGNSILVFWVDRWPEAAAEASAANPDAEATLADALLMNLRWPGRAAQHYRRYLRARPKDPTAVSNLGVALHEGGKLDEALAAFRQAVLLAPDDEGFRANLIGALLERGDAQQAIAEAEAAIVALPDRARLFDLLGQAGADHGDPKRARQAFRKALAIDPQYQAARDHLRELDDLVRQRSRPSGRAPELASHLWPDASR